MTSLETFAAETRGAVLVLHDADSVATTDPLREQDAASVHPLGGPPPEPRSWNGCAVAVVDRAALRRAAMTLPHMGRTLAVALLLTGESQPVYLVPRPEWPPVVQLQTRRLSSGGALTVVTFGRRVAAHVVIQELARLAGTTQAAQQQRIVAIGPGAVPIATDLPPDIVVLPQHLVSSPVLDPEADSQPRVVTDPVLSQGPLDEGLLNPIGFVSDPSEGLAALEAPGGALRLHGVAGLDTLDPTRGATTRIVAVLRDHLGVRVSWHDGSPELARTVAGLAMAGVPLVGNRPPQHLRAWLGTPLSDVIADHVDLSDGLRREEHSVRLRRASLLRHSGPGWAARVTQAASRTPNRFPSCSIVLATRRPQQLDFALRQVAKQRSVDAELVLAAHGFEPDPGRVRELLEGRPFETVALPEDAMFGAVLDAGLRASSGDVVVKMDDDDWYGPDFLLDLLLARVYSGAEVVGTTAEYVYLEELNRTIRRQGTRQDASERFATFVAGGTMSLPRELLLSLGGFRSVRRFVDRQLLQAAQASGASVYRTHGLGYVLRRRSRGHTWDPGVDFFLDPDRIGQQWEGFVPSRIMEADPMDPSTRARVPTPTGTP